MMGQLHDVRTLPYAGQRTYLGLPPYDQKQSIGDILADDIRVTIVTVGAKSGRACSIRPLAFENLSGKMDDQIHLH